MTHRLNQKGRISITSKLPGLVELLIKKTFAVAFFSTVFHIGMVVALMSGIILEILYQTGLASAFGSWGWLFTWFHGAFGLIAAIGFVGVLYRFNTNRFITPTTGKMFCVDATFIGVICASGAVLLLRMLDILPGLWGWETTLHLVSVIAWLLVSLFGGGLVAHALSSIVYPYAKSRSSAASQAFHTLGSFNRIQLAAHVSGSTAPRPGPLPKAERELWMDYSEYWIRNIKCQDACPVHTDARGYVTAIAEGRDEDAYRIARATNPFASICGRVCGAPCELNCRRGDIDAPVSIRALKRFVTEKHGPESGDYDLHRDAYDERMLPPERGDYEKVAVVGAGVSGLTVAHDLTRIGYKVTVFEAYSAPGGMLTVGVPAFRLPRELVKREIDAILSLGVDLECNQRLGRDFTIADLRRRGFEAIFLGIGLPRGRKLDIPGSEAPDVHDGLDFLRACNEGAPLALGRRIVIIGGGMVAYDVARSAVRQRAHSELKRAGKIAFDVARSALRLAGDRDVHVVCLEQRHEMPADDREIVEGQEEGIQLHNGWGPKEIVKRDGDGMSLSVKKCTAVFDESGRFNPTYDESVTQDIEADTVLFAVGQSSDLSFLTPKDGVESEWGLIEVNPETYQTTAPDVFACGDIAHGPRLFIDAIASAQTTARSIHDYLRGKRTDVVVRKRWVPAFYTMPEGRDGLARRDAPVVEPERRVGSGDLGEEVYPEAEARLEASRCLRCNVNTIFDTAICVACYGCVDVCPEHIIMPVGFSRLTGDQKWLQQISLSLGVPPEEIRAMNTKQLDELGAVMMKDETTCVRCAACASRCPTQAVTMQSFEFHRECVSSPTRNPKLNYGKRLDDGN